MTLGLLIDSSSSHLILAISKEGNLLSSLTVAHENRLSKELFCHLRTFFENAKLSFTDLSYLCCGVGPGSYTGTRIGVAIAKAMAYSRNLPLIPLCSLAFFHSLDTRNALSFLKAKSGKYFCFLMKDQPSFFKDLTKDAVVELIAHEQIEKIFGKQEDLLDKQVEPFAIELSLAAALSFQRFLEKKPPLACDLIYFA